MNKLTIALALVIVLLVPTWAQAQLTAVPNTFTAGTTIVASAMNDNFDQIEAEALKRTGGTMTGSFIFGTDNTWDIGASGTFRPRDAHIARKVYTYDLTLTHDLQGVTATFSGAVTAGGLTFSGGAISGISALTASGTVTAATFSGSGASLTALSVPEGAIADGAVFPRLGSTESISGAWTHTNGLTVSSGTSAFQAVTGTTANFSGIVTGGTFSGSGASLTALSVPEGAIADGAVLARVGGNETISGTWTISNAPTIAGAVYFNGVLGTLAHLGGHQYEYLLDSTWPAGTYAVLTPGTGVWYGNGYTLPGTYAIEGTCKSNGSAQGYLGIFDLDGGTPNSPLATATATINTTASRIRSSAISWPNAVRTFGAKAFQDAGGYIACWDIRIIRIS